MIGAQRVNTLIIYWRVLHGVIRHQSEPFPIACSDAWLPKIRSLRQQVIPVGYWTPVVWTVGTPTRKLVIGTLALYIIYNVLSPQLPRCQRTQFPHYGCPVILKTQLFTLTSRWMKMCWKMCWCHKIPRYNISNWSPNDLIVYVL